MEVGVTFCGAVGGRGVEMDVAAAPVGHDRGVVADFAAVRVLLVVGAPGGPRGSG